MTRLITLDLSFCTGIEILPESLGQLTTLKGLSLKGCSNLKALPSDCSQLQQLMGIILGGCDALEVLPAWLADLPLNMVGIDERIELRNSQLIEQLQENGATVQLQYSDGEADYCEDDGYYGLDYDDAEESDEYFSDIDEE